MHSILDLCHSYCVPRNSSIIRAWTLTIQRQRCHCCSKKVGILRYYFFQKLLCARSHCTSIQGRKWVGKLQPSKLVMVSQFDVKSVPLFSAYDMGRAGKFHDKIPMKDVRV